MTPEKKSRLEKFEQEQIAKGFVNYKGKWGTPEEVEKWKKEDFEKEQRAKGLVKYRGKWMTPQEKEIMQFVIRKKKFEREQEEKGLMKFVDKKGREMWGTPEQVKEWKKIDIGMQNDFAELTPRKFERFIANLFTKMGFQVTLGPYVADYGADIIAKRADDTVVIQVKKYDSGTRVGAQVVQQVGGAMLRSIDRSICP